ncbi:10200_t:CDS:2 [Paraglomus brasilianum]|uniref:Protein-S-isoprenylcysteine O-methyltransferase n=1 Tax=Paraglomus brasilianum TaxID=144538 RepID=A0A9N8YYA0_9GLOM|nr:10200_t:CDS:2 [Paraglomus brasilianum]
MESIADSLHANGDSTPPYEYEQPLPSSKIPILDGQHTPQNIALHGFIVGSLFGLGIGISLYSEKLFQLGLFIAALGLFHVLEYLLTAMFNADKLSLDTFLINNGKAYHIAFASGMIEYLIELWLFPGTKKFGFINLIGLFCIIVGQTARSLAMWHAKSNFSHQLVYYKQPDHELVTTGVYAYLRHPSYFGFYYWAIGTQMMLFNPICLTAFVRTLHYFFSERLKEEEPTLIRFFGDEYREYRKRTKTWILSYDLLVDKERIREDDLRSNNHD